MCKRLYYLELEAGSCLRRITIDDKGEGQEMSTGEPDGVI